MVQLVLMGMWQETGASREKSELKATQVKLRTQKKIHQADTLLENLRWTTQVHAQGTQKPPSIISTILLPLKFIRWVSANDILHPRGGAYQKKAAKSNTFKISFWNSEFGGGKGIYSRYYPCDRVTQLKTGRFTVLNTAQRSQKKKKEIHLAAQGREKRLARTHGRCDSAHAQGTHSTQSGSATGSQLMCCKWHLPLPQSVCCTQCTKLALHLVLCVLLYACSYFSRILVSNAHQV